MTLTQVIKKLQTIEKQHGDKEIDEINIEIKEQDILQYTISVI